MIQHFPFPSIPQFRTVVHDILHKAEINDATKPVVTFIGTVKLHGTNAGVAYNAADGLWAQSRTSIITPEKDNAGFAVFVESKKEVFLDLITTIYRRAHLPDDSTVVVFGEWVGKGVQKGVAIGEMEKSFFIFAIQIVHKDGSSQWLPFFWYSNPTANIFNVNLYRIFVLDIDFNAPQLVQNKLIEFTAAVEKECPIAKAFGHSGVGEGVVWTGEYRGETYRFKVKGEEHSVSKVSTLSEVDVAKFESIQAFVADVVTEARLNQAIENVFGGEPLDNRKTGDVIRWMQNDIIKEESDTMAANGIEHREVGSKIAAATRTLFFARID